MSSNNTSNGLGDLVGKVSQTVEDSNKIKKVTSNEMFKNSIMSFMEREMSNMDEIEKAQAMVNIKLIEQMEEDSMDVGELMRFSDMLAKQKTNRISVLFDILKPTQQAANPLLNDQRDENQSEGTNNLSAQELQTLLKFTQVLSQVKEE